MLPGLVLGRELDIEFEGQVFETQLMRPMFPLWLKLDITNDAHVSMSADPREKAVIRYLRV